MTLPLSVIILCSAMPAGKQFSAEKSFRQGKRFSIGETPLWKVLFSGEALSRAMRAQRK
jgi:hypothetical protein